MKIRPIYSFGILILAIGLCAVGWFILQPNNLEPVKAYKTVAPKPHTYEKTETAQLTKEQQQDAIKKAMEERREGILANMRIIRGAESDDVIEKLGKAMETSAYAEYLRKQEAEPGHDAILYFDFLELQGVIDLDGEEIMDIVFGAFFPTGSSIDYEPMMRKQLVEIALENPSKNSREIRKMFQEEDPANAIWSLVHFNGSVRYYEWSENVRQNAASAIAEFTSVDTAIDPALSQITGTFTPDSSTTDGTEENNHILPGQREDTLSPKDRAQILQSIEGPEVELTKDIFADIPNLPTNTDFEKALRERFSPQRFNSALQTLNQYGPKEGIRRLKESDPEVATHLEHLLQPNKETN